MSSETTSNDEPPVSSPGFASDAQGLTDSWLRADNPKMELLLASAVSIWLVLLWIRTAIVAELFNISFPLTFHGLSESPVRVQFALMSWQIVSAVVFGVVCLRCKTLREAGGTLEVRPLTAWFFLGMSAAFALNALNVWPFSFRWAEDSSLQYLSNLHQVRSIASLMLFAVSAIILTPVLEEIVFRFWVLRWSLRLGSRWLGIVASAGLFALVHTPNVQSIFEPRTTNATFWTFALGCALAAITIRNHGRIATSISVHAGVNAAWIIAATIAIGGRAR